MSPQLANGGYVSCTSAVLADTTQEPDFDVALYAVAGTILNGCERGAYYAIPNPKDTAF